MTTCSASWTARCECTCCSTTRLDLRPVDLQRLASDIAAERQAYSGEAPSDIVIGSLPTVHADAGMMRQLLDNLIGNACKYVQPGIVARVRLSASQAGGMWRVEVTDNGIGIPPGAQHLIFGSFIRAPGSESYPGTGLGLAICARIMERHQGRIGVETPPEGGSRFYFTLPGATASPRKADAVRGVA
jgi:signal transduction histidine kinase